MAQEIRLVLEIIQDSKNLPITNKRGTQASRVIRVSHAVRVPSKYTIVLRTFCETQEFYNGSRCTNRDQHTSRLKPRAAASEEGDDECDASRGEQQRVR